MGGVFPSCPLAADGIRNLPRPVETPLHTENAMKRYLHVVAAVIFLLLLCDQWLAWGGLGRAPQVGPVVMEAADRDVGLASVHVLVGQWLAHGAGLDETAIDTATRRFADVIPDILTNPDAALETATIRMPWSVRLGYYGAPIMLLVTLPLWWRRPRSVHLVKVRR